ncbi:MAG TPA: GNAT family N-acetyltransferase [Solirubrobacteraceae bacterium]|jgi:predicted N-acetyltransferase YhbS|nr:GNAT family N-acetyltransferase [Solirubrobacteraceae bacterium]
MEIVDLGPLTDEQRAELEGDEPDPFDVAGVTLRFRRKDRHVGLRDGDGRLVASTGLVVAEVDVGDDRVGVVGLGGVIVNAGYRGRGLARRVVETAVERAQSIGPAYAILFCHADRAGLYERLGFVELAPPVLVEQPDGFAVIDQRTMWRALRPGAEWPAGSVRVHGLPF